MLLLSSALRAAETDWVLVLDRSESMIQNDPRNYRFDAQKIMVDLLSQTVFETHRLTIIRFAGTSEVVLDKQVVSAENLEKIRKTISEDPPQGDTDIGAALALVRNTVKPEGRAADVRVILVSDGVQAGRIPNLAPRFEAEKKAFQDLGLPVHTILLNDRSITPEERGQNALYNEKQLQTGEDLLRDLSRKTRGQALQVKPGKAIEDILLDLITPHMPFYREKVSARLQTLPTDRHLFLFLSKKSRDLRIRIGSKEVEVGLGAPQNLPGDFQIAVTPYQNRAVVTIRPGEASRWPEWVEFLPGKSQVPPEGEFFVISNVRLTTLPGLEVEAEGAEASVKTRVLENELYPVRFGIAIESRVTPDRERMIQDVVKKSTVKVETFNAEGKAIEAKELKGADVLSGTNRLYFLPTQPAAGDTQVKEPFALTVRARIELAGAGSQRALVRAPDHGFVVSPSTFTWAVRKNWKGSPEKSSKVVTRRDLDLELGQELRLELSHAGGEALGDAQMAASFSKASESAAKRLLLRDAGGVPHTFHTDWILPPAPGEYRAKFSLKREAVQEVSYSIRVLRDDFRPVKTAQVDPAEPAKGTDFGQHFMHEKVRFSRLRTIHRLTPEETAKYWKSESASPAMAQILRKDTSKWMVVKQVPLGVEEPRTNGAEVTALYTGEVTDLPSGEYVVAWPEKRSPGEDAAADPGLDRFEVSEPAFKITLGADDGKPLPMEAGKPTLLAGKGLQVSVAPGTGFTVPDPFDLTGTLTWARKDVGAPQSMKAVRAPDGAFTLTFPTTDFHTGAAKLRLKAAWKTPERDRVIEQDVEVLSRPKALGIAIEPVEEKVRIGEKDAALRFRLHPIGGRNAQEQNDLRALWLSRPANATIGESEEIYRIDLGIEGEALLGSIVLPNLPEGTYKLVVRSTVAPLGQDIAACFFDVSPSPFVAKLLRGALGSEERVLLGPGQEKASSEADGVVWVAVEANPGKEGKDPGAKIASAELSVNGKRLEIRWTDAPPKSAGGPAGGSPAGEGESAAPAAAVLYRSEPVPLENLDASAEFTLTMTDDRKRSYEMKLGKLELLSVPLKLEAAWTVPPPDELGRGEFARVTGAVHIRGGEREQRQKAKESLRASKGAFVIANPPSTIQSIQLVEADGSTAGYGERVAFEALLAVGINDTAVKERAVLEIRPEGSPSIDTRTITVVPSRLELLAGRPESDGGLVPAEGLPFFAREKVRLKISDTTGMKGGRRIQVFALGGDAEAASKPIASADGADLEWVPKTEGSYKVVAEATGGPGRGWSAVEEITVTTPLKLEWVGDAAGALKLDSGQKLFLATRIVGPKSLDWESFEKHFQLRAEVKGEGGQKLAVDFTPWELDKEAPSGTVILRTVSTKPPTASAAKVRITLEPRGSKDSGAALDVLDFDIVRGGGSLVTVEDFQAGPAGYVIRDLGEGFSLPKGSEVRLGYRVGGNLGAGAMKDFVTATVVGAEGDEKVLDVEAASGDLVVFTPYVPRTYGEHKLRLEIKGATQLAREFGFNVVKGTTQWALFAVLMAVLAGLLVIGFMYLLRGVSYGRDRNVIRERIDSRKDKALSELKAQPLTNLEGSVRLTLGNRSVGPLELNGTPSVAEVEAWVNSHFSMEPAIFADEEKNQKRRAAIQACLSQARTQLLAETERSLPIRATDICVREVKKKDGASRLEAEVVHDLTKEVPGRSTVLSLRLLDDGKLRVSTASGRSVTLDKNQDFAYNGWIGKKGSQIRASVKVPGIADYSTLTIDLK